VLAVPVRVDQSKRLWVLKKAVNNAFSSAIFPVAGLFLSPFD